MEREQTSNDANWKTDEYVNTLENAVYTLLHEINAHVIPELQGIIESAEVDHSKYNYDGLKSEYSPGYRSIPLHGKTPDSRDKIEIKRLVQPLREALKTLKSAAEKAQQSVKPSCSCGN